MALTKNTSADALLASTTQTSGSSTNSSPITIGYGYSAIATITNGGTAPTNPGTVTLQVSADNSTFYDTDDLRPAGLTASGVYNFVFNLGVCGINGGDWKYARLKFSGNTGQSVTIVAVGSGTSAL